MHGAGLRAAAYGTGDILSLLAAAAIAPLPVAWWPAVTPVAGRLSPGRRRRHRPFAPWESAWFASSGKDPRTWSAAASLSVRALGVRAMLRHSLPPISLDGVAALQQALGEGHGAVVWVLPTRMSDVLSKAALAAAGIRATHLSRRSHGAWRSPRVGPWLNQRLRNVEDRYLAGRIMIGDDNGPGPLRALVRTLQAGGCVTIRLGEGASTVLSLPFIGGSIRIPDGPVRLSRTARAPLFTLAVLPASRGRWRTVFAGPYPADVPVEATVRAVAHHVEELVRARPEPFIGMLPVSGQL